ncbi:hypothetical protein [Streptomyces sp. NPDC050704]|uniref:hypothetical protein n=1 Tax=Streptomyces sp. NPDC050704 TaxID=3157219 RepID=UPI003446573F
MSLLERELCDGRRALADLGAEDAWLAFVRFGRRRLRTPDSPDADGLLFQYGTYSFDGPPTFTLDFTRQFEVSDGDGGHDHYVQVHCELRFGADPALQALGSFDSWFFHDAEDDLDRWAEELGSREVWRVIRGLRPALIKVYQDRV